MLSSRFVRLVNAIFLRSFGGRRGSWVVEVEIKVVVSRNVAGIFSAANFFLILAYHRLLDHLSTGRIDGVSDVGIQLGTTIVVGRHTIRIE